MILDASILQLYYSKSQVGLKVHREYELVNIQQTLAGLAPSCQTLLLGPLVHIGVAVLLVVPAGYHFLRDANNAV